MAYYSKKPLNAQQLAFVDELLMDPARVAVKAYRRIFGEGHVKNINQAAYDLSRDPRIIQEIAERDYVTAERNQLKVDRLVQHLLDIVEADPRELSEYRRGACRYCHGENHRYQFTMGELERAVAQYKRENLAAQSLRGEKPPYDPLAMFFDYRGGVGFDPRKPAHPDCPECFGHGEGYEHFNDTRDISAQGARLYSGVQKTKEGLKIAVRSQDKALELALRVAGMLSEKPKEDDTPPPPVAVNYVQQDASDPNGPANPAGAR